MKVRDLGLMEYRQAWAIQEQAHQRVLEGESEQLLLVEHPPVITFGRRPGVSRHLIASREQLEKRGVTVVESDRGGDITYHEPGQLVAYPIVRLADHKLSVSGYVHRLEALVVETMEHFGIRCTTDALAVGVWTTDPASGGKPSAKIAAIGVRIRRGVSLHGVAINVCNDLSGFGLIVPCGLADRAVTSMSRCLPQRPPTMQQVKQVLADRIGAFFGSD